MFARDSQPTGKPSISLQPADKLRCSPLAFDAIPRSAWERLYRLTSHATPFARWTFHRAWWDAYGETAHEQYMVAVDDPSTGEPDAIRAIIPLMHRHEEEPEDERTATVLRRQARAGTRLRPEAKAIFFGASYHADYATLLCPPDDLAAAAAAVVRALSTPSDPAHGEQAWDVIDLRRLRREDPALAELERPFQEQADRVGWQFIREQEDVCPVVTVAPGASWEDHLAILRKKARHEIRRKLRRAEAGGALSVSIEPPSAEAIDSFIALHRKRFGEEGLFPQSEGGERSRRFVHRLAELEALESDCQLHIAEVRSGDQLIFSALAFDDGFTCFLYNAGMDPEAAELSPGVSGTAEYMRNRIEAGRRRFDFMRGSEPYKYEWGARDEPIDRLLVLREATA